MKMVIGEGENQWYGALFTEEGKLYSTSFLFETKKELVAYLMKQYKGNMEIEENNENIVIQTIRNIVEGTCFDILDIVFDFREYSGKEQQVLETLLTVPPGQLISYGELAKKAGFPGAARFVGNVMAKNRFAPIIPCHRVILSNGNMGNYSGRNGRKTKKKLIEQEKES